MLKEKLPESYPVDLAGILERLDRDERLVIFSQFDTGQASHTLEEAEPRVKRKLIAALDKKRAAELINDYEPGPGRRHARRGQRARQACHKFGLCQPANQPRFHGVYTKCV